MKRYRLPVFILTLAVIAVAAVLFLRNTDFAILHPEGLIAQQQLKLITITVLLSLIVVIPVFILTFYIVWKYRDRGRNHKATYTPDWDRSKKLETVWWLIPLILILILSGIIWKSSHQLDPYRPLSSTVKPITIQVIALNWKWLFIYPEQNIATVNYVQFPEKTPINFRLTADAPMNSFWIPKLGGQVYAMAGMETKLHLEASDIGEFHGSSANISGEGFAGMGFTAQSSSTADFEQWIQFVKQSEAALEPAEYAKLVQPSKDNPLAYYGSSDASLYDSVIMKYMMPSAPKNQSAAPSPGMEGREMSSMDHMHHEEYH